MLDAAIEASDEPRRGQEAMLAKLSELMFVEALRPTSTSCHRRRAAGWPDCATRVGAALRLIHGRYAEPWTLERLAREVGMSRSSFADRFTAYVGLPR